MRELPSNLTSVVQEGIDALGWLEAIIERRLISAGQKAELLLALRDVTGLAGRLASMEPDEWSHGWARNMLSPLDVGVLESWEREAQTLIHSSEDPTPTTSWRHLRALTMLRRFLESYLT